MLSAADIKNLLLGLITKRPGSTRTEVLEMARPVKLSASSLDREIRYLLKSGVIEEDGSWQGSEPARLYPKAAIKPDPPVYFTFSDLDVVQAIRVVTLNAGPWFVAPDVCRALGLDLTGGTLRWLAGLDPEEMRFVTRTSRRYPELFAENRIRSMALVSELGLQKLIKRSAKPQVEPFREWLAATVIPALRKKRLQGTRATKLPRIEGKIVF